MAADERIIIEVDTTELDEAIAKAKQLISIGTRGGFGPNIATGIKKRRRETERFKRLFRDVASDVPRFIDEVGETDLPGVNRELRLILGQQPQLRRMVTDYFRLKRIQRSIGIATAEATMLRDILTNPQLILTTVATLIILVKSVHTYMVRLKKERMAYEEFIRREMKLSKREYDFLKSYVSGGIKGGSGAGARSNYYWSIPG